MKAGAGALSPPSFSDYLKEKMKSDFDKMVKRQHRSLSKTKKEAKEDIYVARELRDLPESTVMSQMANLNKPFRLAHQ